MGRASGGSNTSHWIRNDAPDFQGAMSAHKVKSELVPR